MTACSSDMMLARMLNEQLDEVAHASIVDHVESCVHCQERLKDLTSDCSRIVDREQLNRSSTDPWLTGNAPGSGSTADQCMISPFLLPSPRGPALRSLADDERFTRATYEGRRARGPILDVDLPAVEGYEIIAELGHGGMGVVYKARHQSLGRFVALKMIRAGSLAKPEDLARFRIEAEAVAKQRHPNIIQIYDIGETGGLPFVALELLEGGSLEDFLAATPQPGEFSARLSATLARAVHTAHQAGIIHRDLKPSNVMFASEGTPKITDFGLAKRLEEDGYTETGQVLGSPSYIPPEQAQGLAKEVGPAADVYSLGAILYEMLTGRPPFKGTTPVETVMQVLNEDPVPPSQLQPHVPRDLETICLKCLAKEPQKRYASALALAEDLDRYLADTPIQARRVPAFERARKWVRRRPIRSFLLAFSALAVSIGLFTSVRSDARFRAARSQFQAELTRYENDLIAGRYPIQELSRLETSTEGDRRFADEHSRALYLLREAQNGREEQESSARARERLRRFLDLRDVALFQDTQLTGLDPSDSVAAVRESALAALRLFAADSPRANQWALAPFHSSLTEQDRDHVNRGCYEMLMVLAEAIAQPLPGESPAAQARQALEILDRAAILCREPTHAYHLKRAACLERAGDVDGAKRERTAADRIRPDGAFDHFLTGLEQYKHGHLAEAKRHFAAALQARANHFWAQCLLATCDLNNRHASADVAKAYLTTCVQTHPELPWLYLLRGFAWGELGSRAASASREAEAAENFAAAEADYAEALRRDPEGKFRYALLVDRGLVRFHSGKLAEAVADLEAAIALGPRQLSAYVTMAQIHRQRHQLDRAFEALDRAIALKPNIAALYRTRARWNLERPDATPAARAEALADLDRAIRFGAPNSADLAKDHAERGRVLLLDRQFQRALDACDAALRIDPKDAGVHRWRVGALLELKREREAIDACDAYLRAGRGSADLFGLRGLAKARRNDFAGAIDDYTLALGLQANAPVLHARRGWAYLVSGAPQLALRDFEEAIRLDPSSGDAYSGRGSALVTLGRWREAVADAEESLRHGESEARLHYSAARILALAAESDKKEDRSRGPTVPRKTGSHQDRAVVLLGLALERTPPGKRAAFWREVVHSDQAFTAIRRLPAYARMAGAVDPPPAH